MNGLKQLRLFFAKHLNTSRIFILSFFILILLGAVLLSLPFSSPKGDLPLVDALFTSASAVCVTGLSTIDIGKDLSLGGQVITLLLFQLGGLGIVTFSTLLFGLMGRGISFKGQDIIQATLLHTPRRDFFTILKWVFKWTLLIEGIGTVVLFFRFLKDFSPATAFFQSLYHSVSAFNNCGLSLFSKSLEPYQADWLINLTVMALIILGGIGFIVQYEVASYWRGGEKRLSVHTKMVLLTTAALLIGGAALIYFFESNHVLKNAPLPTKILTSLFQATSPRTCGFNTVNIGLLANTTILVLLVLMFIGASPGSTGGGIKTTSFAILVMMIRNRFRRQEEVNVFNRTVPREVLTRTIAIVSAAALSVFLITSVLLLASNSSQLPATASRHLFVEYLFETVSAFGTVGLSMGITATLSVVQKLAIVLLMFVGRVGPLTLAFALSLPKKGITYAEESVMVG